MYINEIRIYNEDMDYIPEREVCKNTLIQNNYVKKIGDGNWAAPGIQYYLPKRPILYIPNLRFAVYGNLRRLGLHDYPTQPSAVTTISALTVLTACRTVCLTGRNLHAIISRTLRLSAILSAMFITFSVRFTLTRRQYFKVIDNVYESVQLSNFPLIRPRGFEFLQ